MNIKDGFQLEQPEVFIPWSITQSKLRKLLGKYGLRHITTGYFVITCQSLGRMKHELGFHFGPRFPWSLCLRSHLERFEFYRKEYPNQKQSYDEFQKHFEQEFGKPSERKPGSEGFDLCIWNFESVRIVHSVYDRFGPEEHMDIAKLICNS